MHGQRIKNVINLTDMDRYNYSIREFAKLKKVWAISTSDSWLTIINTEGKEVFPIWPHQEAAEICMLNEMKVEGFTIDFIEFQKFKELCIPDMIVDKILFGVFCSDKREGIDVEGETLLKDLTAEEETDL